jgi:integrase
VPHLGAVDLRRLTPAMVRSWRQGLLDAGVGQGTVSKAYRLLLAVLHTAADDEVIRRNPCRIRGAAVDRTPERPVLTLDEVLRIADAIEDRFRALVLLAAFGSLRWGELMGLRRSELDLDGGVIKVVRSVAEVGSKQVVKVPKSAAGTRDVVLPRAVLPELRRHLALYASQVSTDACSWARRVRRRTGRRSTRSGRERSTGPG